MCSKGSKGLKDYDNISFDKTKEHFVPKLFFRKTY
jgi:hypothetical protein